MRVARVLVAGPSEEWESGRPRIAISRDDALYDVEALEDALGTVGETRPPLCDPSDYHTRVATLRSAGLHDLDARLLRGERPSAARIPPGESMLLAPCDTDRSALIVVDLREVARGGRPICRLGQARSLLGDGALVGVRDELGNHVSFEASIAVLVGEDLAGADARQVNAAIQGYAIFVDWFVAGRPSDRVPGVSGALGPHLVSRYALPKLADARATIRIGDRAFSSGSIGQLPMAIAESVAFAARDLDVRSGDVVVIGPLPGATSEELRAGPAFHERVEIAVDGLGTLGGTAVPRR